jgi:hypothetical protein
MVPEFGNAVDLLCYMEPSTVSEPLSGQPSDELPVLPTPPFPQGAALASNPLGGVGTVAPVPSAQGAAAALSSPDGSDEDDPENPFQDDPAAAEGAEGPERRPGRRKITIEYIEDKSKRHITFSKRKSGIMKKVPFFAA